MRIPAALRALALSLCGLLVGLTAGGCRRDEAPTSPRWNVVVVLVDALRADRLPLYGYGRDTAPNLAALAREGVVFRDARAQAGCTFPSVNSILTSRHPWTFLGPGRKGMGIPAGIPALPELLAARGWDTAAVSSSVVVRKTPTHTNPAGGFGRGFRTFDESCRLAGAACVNQRARELVRELREPYFLYLHYLEPHAPYHPPEWHPRRWSGDGAGLVAWVRNGVPRTLYRKLYDQDPDARFDAADVTHLRDLYDEEIAFFDQRFGELVGELRAAGQLERTLIVLLSDHGEELLDHGGWGHCRDLAWDTVLATPLVMRIPGGPAGVMRHAPVANLDVVPTILDYLAVPTDGLRLDGKSLRPAIADDHPVRRYRFAQQGTMRVVADGRYALLHDLRSGRSQLFDLRADPGQRTDLAAAQPQLVAGYRDALFAWVREQEGQVGGEESLRRAAEEERQLRAVGYL